jgi:ketosteroid isomerase-like protein
MIFRTLCLIAMTCLTACSNIDNPEQLTVEQQRDIETEIARQIDDLRKAWANMDAPAIASFYSERSRDTFNGERFTYADLMDWATVGYTGITSTDIGEFEDYRVDVLGPDAAVVSWQNQVGETPAEQEEVTRYVAFMTQVWIREGSEWRLLHNHESTLDLDASN